MPAVSPNLAVWVSYTASPDEQPSATQAHNIDTLPGFAGLELEASLASLSSIDGRLKMLSPKKRSEFSSRMGSLSQRALASTKCECDSDVSFSSGV